jgi:hypothetical protein
MNERKSWKTTIHSTRVQLTDMVKSTPGTKIPQWRSTIKWAILMSINGNTITTKEDAANTIALLRQQGLKHATCQFATVGYHGIHPTEGSLMLYYDQLNVIEQHLRQAYHETYDKHHNMMEPSPNIPPSPNIRQLKEPDPHIADSDLGQFFTLQQLKQ